MDSRIILTNRDGAKVWLEQINNDIYSINSNKKYIIEHMRIIYDSVPDDAEIYDFNWSNGKKAICHAIDPSGGPYISLGTIIDNKYKIIRIYGDNGIKIKLQKI